MVMSQPSVTTHIGIVGLYLIANLTAVQGSIFSVCDGGKPVKD